MTATSFDRTAAAIGARAWRRLHLIGGYYLLFQFMVSFGKRIPDMPLYALFLIPLVAVFALRMIAMAPRAQATRADGMILIARKQMIFPPQPAMHRHDGAVDVADQAVAENDVGDFPVAALANVGKPAHRGHGRRFASRLAAKRVVGDLRQLRSALSRRHWWPRPSSSLARASVMLRMHSPASSRAMVPSPMP